MLQRDAQFHWKSQELEGDETKLFSFIGDELPSSIGDLENLEELNAANGTLKHTPEDVERLHKLRILDLSYSEICQLPSTIDKLPLLRRLLLEGCDRIQVLPNLPSSLITLRVS